MEVADLAGERSGTDPSQLATDGVKLVFSWVLLMPIAVIVSGKLLTKTMSLSIESKQLFQVKIPKVLELQADNEEVILGFTGFLLTLLVIGLTAGKHAYRLFVDSFGVDPGQFNSLCVLSSFVLVAISAVLTLGRYVSPRVRRGAEIRAEHEVLIEEIARRSE